VSYFIILPLFVFFEALLLVAFLAARKSPKLRQISGYIGGVLQGSIAGFIIANLYLWSVSILPAVIAQKYALPEIVQTLTKINLALGLFLGPYVASLGGLTIGGIVGLVIVFLRRKTLKGPMK
jgi:hypothetical protein